MNYIEIPNLPQRPVSLAVVDGRITSEIEKVFLSYNINLIKTKNNPALHDSISYHPDIVIHHIGYNRIVYAPGTDEKFLKELFEYGFELIKGKNKLSAKYPHDIAYNVARVGGFYFHNLKYTDPILKKELEKSGVEAIDVNQGYTKCSISVIDKNSIITSDAGIAKAAEKKGIDVALLNSDQNINLPGLSCGFIGGSTGLIGKDTWAVSGDAKKLSSYAAISSFLTSKKIQIISLSSKQVVDIGTIIPLMTE